MPTVPVVREELFKALGKRFTDEEFDELCFEFGIELDEVTSEKMIKTKESGRTIDASEEIIYKIEVPANRYDLLCLEGLSRALLVFLNTQKQPVYKTYKPKSQQKIFVKPSTAEVRPFVVGAILRDIQFNPVSYQSFIDLQDRLHQNICRKRTLVAIGTHDLDTIEGPFTYDALPPKDIVFAPLNQTERMNGERLMEFYESDKNLKKFLPIIKDKPRYPVITDGKGVVLSLPPIINGDHSKITLNTRNVFIECTATDLTKAKIVLNTMVTMFGGYCKRPFEVEEVEVIYPDNTSHFYPDLSTHEISASVTYVQNAIGVKIEAEKMANLAQRMCLEAKLSDDKSAVVVQVPPTRSDILHACDVMEDIAIAFGFNNVPHTIPKTAVFGQPLPINKLSDLVRREVAFAGFTEVLTFALCSEEENFQFLNKVDDGTQCVKIANPQTFEFQIVRTTLLPGILKTVEHNKDMQLPIKVFEISDVVLKDSSRDVGSRNERRVCGLYMGKSSGFEIIHGLLDRLMEILDVKPSGSDRSTGYYIQPSEDSSFFPDRRADIFYNGKQIGVFGIIHPTVLQSFGITYPCSALEFNLEHFL